MNREQENIGIHLFNFLGMINSTNLTHFQKDLLRAEFLLEMGFDAPKGL